MLHIEFEFISLIGRELRCHIVYGEVLLHPAPSPLHLRPQHQLSLQIDLIARTMRLGEVLHGDLLHPTGAALTVDAGDPIVHPPVLEGLRVVMGVDEVVSAMSEVVSEDALSSLPTHWTSCTVWGTEGEKR